MLVASVFCRVDLIFVVTLLLVSICSVCNDAISVCLCVGSGGVLYCCVCVFMSSSLSSCSSVVYVLVVGMV